MKICWPPYGKSDRFSKDFKLVCFGGGKLSSDEISGFKDYGVDRNHIIHVTGDDRVLSSLYRHAECFVFPSLYEGFGIPVLEAMACRCPIITGNESAIPEVASSAAEYFNPHEIESISRAMEKVLYDEEPKESPGDRRGRTPKILHLGGSRFENQGNLRPLDMNEPIPEDPSRSPWGRTREAAINGTNTIPSHSENSRNHLSRYPEKTVQRMGRLPVYRRDSV